MAEEWKEVSEWWTKEGTRAGGGKEKERHRNVRRFLARVKVQQRGHAYLARLAGQFAFFFFFFSFFFYITYYYYDYCTLLLMYFYFIVIFL